MSGQNLFLFSCNIFLKLKSSFDKQSSFEHCFEPCQEWCSILSRIFNNLESSPLLSLSLSLSLFLFYLSLFSLGRTFEADFSKRSEMTKADRKIIGFAKKNLIFFWSSVYIFLVLQFLFIWSTKADLKIISFRKKIQIFLIFVPLVIYRRFSCRFRISLL